MFTMRKPAVLVVLLSSVLFLSAGCGGSAPPEPPAGRSAGRLPTIDPDYAGVTIPPNVSPLNFRVREPGRRCYVRLRSASGEAFSTVAPPAKVVLPEIPWAALLKAARGGDVSVDVCVQGFDGDWTAFDPFTVHVAPEEMDRYIVYRQLGYVYMFWGPMRLRQRDVSTYEDTVLLDNDVTGGGCMNCHTFLASRPEKALVQFRSGAKPYGYGMLVIQDGRITKVDTKTPQSIGLAAISSWHPSGRVVAFSMDAFRQFFHSRRSEVREVYDMKSDLAIYLVDECRVTGTAAISRPDRLEAWPAWSADGKYLYFSSAAPPPAEGDWVPSEAYAGIRYDLMRIPYDVGTNTWGELETVLSSERAGGSVTQPRPSPDGRFIAFCLSDHSVFPTFEPDADLFLLNLADGSFARMECSGEGAESWHSWSRNGRWLVFSSKRDDGVFIRPYFAHVDESGHAAKPFILPQKDPAFYDSFCYMYQLPEFLAGPLPVTAHQLARAIRYDEWHSVGPPTTAASPTAGGASQTGAGVDTGLPWRAR
jgi:hypothetical protein